jgi:hypothetical protein
MLPVLLVFDLVVDWLALQWWTYGKWIEWALVFFSSYVLWFAIFKESFGFVGN